MDASRVSIESEDGFSESEREARLDDEAIMQSFGQIDFDPFDYNDDMLMGVDA